MKNVPKTYPLWWKTRFQCGVDPVLMHFLAPDELSFSSTFGCRGFFLLETIRRCHRLMITGPVRWIVCNTSRALLNWLFCVGRAVGSAAVRSGRTYRQRRKAYVFDSWQRRMIVVERVHIPSLAWMAADICPDRSRFNTVRQQTENP